MRMFNFTVIILYFFVLVCFLKPEAQAGSLRSFPEIGQPLPNFSLSNVLNYKNRSISLKDFAGSWLVLDFWDPGCTSCLKSFTKTDSFQKVFGSQLHFILIGYNGGPRGQSTRKVYEKYQEKYGLNLTTVYDSAIFVQFGVRSVPHLFWIDNQGTVKAITTSEDLTIENVRKFLNGKDLNLEEAESEKWYQKDEHPFNIFKPLLIDGNGGNDSTFIYRSVLIKWSYRITPAVPPRINMVLKWRNMNVFQATGVSLAQLYKLAYSDASFYSPRDSLYGTFYTNPVLEVAHPDSFNTFSSDKKDLYCYSFSFPADRYSPEFIQETLKHDLLSYFGYQVTIENRIMPCWKLTCSSETREKLRSKGTRPSVKSSVEKNVENSKMANIPIKLFLYSIWGPLFQFEPPIINETGIDYNIDITKEGLYTDFNDMKRTLEKNGLFLEKGQKEIKVIVIRNPVPVEPIHSGSLRFR